MFVIPGRSADSLLSLVTNYIRAGSYALLLFQANRIHNLLGNYISYNCESLRKYFWSSKIYTHIHTPPNIWMHGEIGEELN